MKFIDLQTQYQQIETKIQERIKSVLSHGQYIMGPEIKELETALAQFCNSQHCVSISSGTDALLIALMALGVTQGDEVIMPAFTFISPAEVVALLGAKPVFVDVCEQSYNLDPNALEAAITPNTKAIIAVSLYGQCADFEAINKIAHTHQIPVIEDGAQSFGATQRGHYSCALSTIGCTSFFPSKPLGGYGDGGACFTNDSALADKMAKIRVHGQTKRYYHEYIGVNGRMDTLQAAIVLEKLDLFPAEIQQRQRIAQRYTDALQDSVITPFVTEHNTSVYAQYTIRVNDRPAFQAHLKSKDIPTAVHYPVPLYQQPVFSQNASVLPVTEKVSAEVCSLPFHPYLTEADQDRIIDAVKSYETITA